MREVPYTPKYQASHVCPLFQEPVKADFDLVFVDRYLPSINIYFALFFNVTTMQLLKNNTLLNSTIILVGCYMVLYCIRNSMAAVKKSKNCFFKGLIK